MQRFYQAADLFVLPSRMEGLPNSVLEAMACGLPVVASALDGISEVITHRANGLLIAPDDAIACREAILYLLRAKKLARDLAAAAVETIMADYSLDAIAARYLDLYTTLAESGGRARDPAF